MSARSRDVAAIAVSAGVTDEDGHAARGGTAIGVETARAQPAELLPQALQRAHAAA